MKILDNKFIDSMQNKKKVTDKYSEYYLMLYEKYNNKFSDSLSNRFFNKYINLKKCLDVWIFDKYERNKVLDLVKVQRCKDKFCPNCRNVQLSQALVNFRPRNEYMLQKGYEPYLLTLTVPNVPGEELDSTIDRMNKSFRKFNLWLSSDFDKKDVFKNRLFRIKAMVKRLEITIDSQGNYHPHFHCIAYIDPGENKRIDLFVKNIEGVFSKRYSKRLYNSLADIEIMKLWYFAYNNISLKKYNKYIDKLEWLEFEKRYNYYICDIRFMDDKGIYEVFKYCFKDSDIVKFEQFETLYFALYRKRLTQGYGEFYNLDLEPQEIDYTKENIDIYLKVDKKESPAEIKTGLNELNTLYQEYLKISRFRGTAEIDKIEEFNN